MMPRDPTGMRVSVTNVLGAHADAWDSLVDSMPIPSPFLRSWWLDTAAGSRPCIVLVLQGNRLVGGLALESDRHLGVQRLRLLGAGPLCPDHLDAVAAPGMRAEVAAVLGGWLARPGDRIVDLDGVVSDSLVAAVLPGRVRRQRTAVAPCVTLCGGYLERRSPTLRRLVHRAERRLLRDAGSCIVEHVDDVELALRLLYRLHAQRWGDASTFLGDFGRFATVCRAAAARGELAMDVLRAGSEVVAIVASFEVAGRISQYQSGRIPAQRWRTAGTVLLAHVLDDAARRGLREADLLRGDEAYKALFADGRRELWRLRCAVGSRALVALQIDLAAGRGRRLAGRTRRRLRSIATRRQVSRLSSESSPRAGR
jgi:CelD/BcsL family acetyltransferase involved in cellulose biosynthesis